jgi:lipopolysaccharide transport system permease protein
MSASAPTTAARPVPMRPGLWRLLNPVVLVVDLWSHRDLIWRFTAREISGRYRGSHLGLLWSFITPIALLLVYTFVFGVIFKARWKYPDDHTSSLAEFALVMFAGQLAFQAFSEPVGRAGGLITGVPNFVKKVVFPLQILPVTATGAALYHVAVGIAIAIVASFPITGHVPWTACLVPLSLLPLAMLGLGCAWFLAALGVYLRDVSHVIDVVLRVLFYATPVLYPLDMVNDATLKLVLQLNPLTPMIELVRDHLIMGSVGSGMEWGLAYGFSVAAMVLGYAWFMITRRGFADVL